VYTQITFLPLQSTLTAGFFNGDNSTVKQVPVHKSCGWTSKCKTCRTHTERAKVLTSSKNFATARKELIDDMEAHYKLMRAERQCYYQVRLLHSTFHQSHSSSRFFAT